MHTISKHLFAALIAASMMMGSCTQNNSPATNTAAPPTANKYEASLKEASARLNKAMGSNDSATYFSLIDDSVAITLKGATMKSDTLISDLKKNWGKYRNDSTMTLTDSFTVEKIAAGSQEPVWAGYESGIFTQSMVSKDNKYNRKISGPYYRAWKLVNGQWKCYVIVYMAFTCEGQDCK